MGTEQVRTEGSEDESLEKHYKVQVPSERLIRLQEAETGMDLARDVTNDTGQLLFPSGKTLDSRSIQRLRNFGKKSIFIKDVETQWVTEDEYRELPASVECLDEKELPREDPENDSEDDDLSDRFLKAFDFVKETNSPRRLREFIEDLHDEALSLNVHEVINELESTLSQAGEMEDLVQYLLTQLSNIDDGETRQKILERLYEMNDDTSDLRDDESIPEDVAVELEQTLDARDKTRNGVLDVLHDHPEILEPLSRKDLPETTVGGGDGSGASDTELEEESETPDNVPDYLLDLILLASQGNFSDELHKILSASLEDEGIDPGEIGNELERLGEQSSERGSGIDNLDSEEIQSIQNLLESDPEERDLSVEECLFGAFESIEDGNWSGAINGLNKCLDKSLEGSVPSQLKDYNKKSLDLITEKKKLSNRFDEKYRTPDPFEKFEQLFELNDRELYRAVSDIDITDEDAEALRVFLRDRQELIFEFWDDLRDFLPDLMNSVEESNQTRVLEEFQELTDDVILNRIKKPLQEGWVESDSPVEGMAERKREVLTDAVERKDLEKIKKLNSLPDSVLEEVNELYEVPRNMNKWQQQLINQYEKVFEHLIFGLRVNRDDLDQFLRKCGEVFETEEKIFNLFSQPPTPEHYHFIHAYNSALLCVLIGRDLDLPEKGFETLLLGASLADVGLTVIPNSFYLKGDELSRRAENEIRKHPIYSQRIASHIFGPKHTVTILVGEHHERLDGSGYPAQKNGEDLSPLTSILSCADAYTAMIEDRPYREARMPDQVLDSLAEKPEAISPKAVDSIKNTIGFYPNGSVVKLSNGALAFVKKQNPDQPRQPEVFLLTDENRNRLESPKKCDLSSESDRSIDVLLRV